MAFDTDHFDSIVVGALLLAYPLYSMFITVTALIITTCWYWVLLLFILPFTAWAYVQLKKQLD